MLIKIQKSRTWKVGQFERNVLGRKAAVATSSSTPWMMSLAIVRGPPLGISRDAATWARTRVVGTEIQIFIACGQGKCSGVHSRA